MSTATIKKASVATPATESTPGVRRHDAWAAGDVGHQGDCILIGLPAVPKNAAPRRSRQVADGNTRGSQHVLDGGKIYDADKGKLRAAIKMATKGRVDLASDAYVGPVFEGPCVLTHPQHEHQEFPAGSICAVVYQRNMSEEEREVRARD